MTTSDLTRSNSNNRNNQHIQLDLLQYSILLFFTHFHLGRFYYYIIFFFLESTIFFSMLYTSKCGSWKTKVFYSLWCLFSMFHVDGVGRWKRQLLLFFFFWNLSCLREGTIKSNEDFRRLVCVAAMGPALEVGGTWDAPRYCPICARVYSNNSNLRRHLRSAHATKAHDLLQLTSLQRSSSSFNYTTTTTTSRQTDGHLDTRLLGHSPDVSWDWIWAYKI